MRRLILACSSCPPFFWFAGKVVFMFFLISMVKAIVPRYRYDQLMRLGWKVFLPTALAAVALVSGYVVMFGRPAAQAAIQAVGAG